MTVLSLIIFYKCTLLICGHIIESIILIVKLITLIRTCRYINTYVDNDCTNY